MALGAALLIGLGAAGYSDNTNRLILSGLPAALIVWGAAMAKRHGRDLTVSPLLAIGDASYSIYLSQVIALPIGGKLWHLAGWGFGGWRLPLFMACEVAMALGVGFAVFHALERPLLSFLRKHLGRAEARLVPAAQAA